MTQLARAVGLTQATTHRLLQSLVAEGMVEQDERSKLYRLSIDFFALAAHAGNPGDLRTLCRPVLLRLCASLGRLENRNANAAIKSANTVGNVST